MDRRYWRFEERGEEERATDGPAMLQDCRAVQKVQLRLVSGDLNCKISILATNTSKAKYTFLQFEFPRPGSSNLC